MDSWPLDWDSWQFFIGQNGIEWPGARGLDHGLSHWNCSIPSGKRLYNYGKIHHFLMGKSTITMENHHFLMGKSTITMENHHFLMGKSTITMENHHFLMGKSTITMENHTFLMGKSTITMENHHFLMGKSTITMENHHFLMGKSTITMENHHFLMGKSTIKSISLYNTTTTPLTCTVHRVSKAAKSRGVGPTGRCWKRMDQAWYTWLGSPAKTKKVKPRSTVGPKKRDISLT